MDCFTSALIAKFLQNDEEERNNKALHSGSLKKTDSRKLHSGDSKLVEDDFTNIEAPPGRDSAIGSGMDDDDDLDVKSVGMESDILNQLQSKVHNMGDEQYIVFDFITNSESVSQQPLPTDNIEITLIKPKTESIYFSESSEILEDNSSPFTTVKNPCKMESNFSFDVNEDIQPGSDISVSRDLIDIVKSDEVPCNIIQEEVIDVSLTINDKSRVINTCKDIKIKTDITPAVNVDVDTVSNPVKVNGFSHGLEMDETIDIVDNIPESIIHAEPKENLNPTAAVTVKRKVFSAGRGLKKAKEEQVKAKNENPDIPTPGTNTKTSNNGPVLHKDVNISPVSTPPKKTSNTCLNSPDLKRTGSLKSLNNESSPTSIVKQNKLLFDQRVANELKAKYRSPEDKLGTRFGSVGKGSLNGFELDRSERQGSNSFSDSTEQLNLTGIVAGARSIFEGGRNDTSKTEMPRSSSNTAIKQPERVPHTEAPNKNTIKQTPSPPCESVIINTVPDLPSAVQPKKPKKKKFPFKKVKRKNNKKESVELIGAKLIDSNQSYDERAIDVAALTSHEPDISDTCKSVENSEIDVVITDQEIDQILNASEIQENSTTDQNGNQNTLIDNKPTETISISEKNEDTVIVTNGVGHDKVDIPSVETILSKPPEHPIVFQNDVNNGNDNPMETQLSVPVKPSVDNPGKPTNGGSETRRSKKRRLCKTRNPSVLSITDPDPEVIISEPVPQPTNNTYVSGTIVNLVPDDEEEILIETVINDVPIWSFDKLDDLSSDEIISEKPDPNINIDVCVDPLVTLSNQNNMMIDIDTLQNESPIDELIEENHTSNVVCPVEPGDLETNKSNSVPMETGNVNLKKEEIDVSVTVSEVDEDVSSTVDYLSDATGSLYDGDSINLSVNMDNNIDTVEEKKRKKKSKFPFHLRLGKKTKGKSKNELASPDNVFTEDTSSESSFRVAKKKKKSKNSEKTNENLQGVSTSSNDAFPSVSSTSSLSKSPNLNDKSRSKLLPFFKKKSSSSLADTKNESNELEPNGKLKSVSTPSTPTMSKHKNGHSSRTDHTNGHKNVKKRENLI